MTLIKCMECGQEISDMVTTCPKCGAPQKKVTIKISPKARNLFLVILGIVLIVAILYYVLFVLLPVAVVILLGIALGVMLFVVTIYLITTYNQLNRLYIEVERCWGKVQVVYQRRIDLVPKLIELAQKYSVHEKDLLTDVTKLRSQWGESKTPQEKIKTSGELDIALSRLLVVTENYPNLKANESFMQIQNELSTVTEEEIKKTRTEYNNAIAPYNNTVCCFPSNIIAWVFKFTKMDFYAVGK